MVVSAGKNPRFADFNQHNAEIDRFELSGLA
jgi:hypothetical protein